jgi:uncharacterized protein (TIGR03435 family)
MVRKAATTKTSTTNRAAGVSPLLLERYWRVLEAWPRFWMGWEKGPSAGEDLVARFRPSLEDLAASDRDLNEDRSVRTKNIEPLSGKKSIQSRKLGVHDMNWFGPTLCWCLLILPVVARGQSSNLRSKPRFEVASVKLGDNTAGVKGGCHGIDSKLDPNDFAPGDVPPPLGRCLITNARLSHLIMDAYRLPLARYAKGGPNWMSVGDVRFTIEAKCENPATTTEAQLLEMLQDLLVDRFGLRYRREERTERGFALRLTNGDKRLARSAATKTETHFSFPPAVNAQGRRIPGRPISIRAASCSMGKLAEFLSVYGPG